MAAAARDRTRRWEPFGVTEADFAAVPERDGVRVVNVTPGVGGPGPGQAGWWLRGAAVALGVLAAAAAAVSWEAQYAMVRAVKPVPVVAALEAGIPDVGAVVFATAACRARVSACSARSAWRWPCTVSGRCGPGR